MPVCAARCFERWSRPMRAPTGASPAEASRRCPRQTRCLRYQWYRAQRPRSPVAHGPFVRRRTDRRRIRRGALRSVAREGAHDPRAARPGRAAPQRRPAATQGLRRTLPTPPRHEPRGLGWPSSPKGSRTRGSAKPSRLVATISSRCSLTPRPSPAWSPTPGATRPARPSSTHTSTAGAVASLFEGTARIASWRAARCQITGSPSVERLGPADAPWRPGLPSACGAPTPPRTSMGEEGASINPA